MTHSGFPKELIFESNRNFFEPWLEKIVHIILDSLPNSPDHWVRERAQRDGIHEGLEQSGADGEDLLIVSDTDEIPRRSTIRALSWCDGFRSPLQLRSAFFYYSLEHRWTERLDVGYRPFQWKQPRAILVSQLAFPRLTVNHLRYDPADEASNNMDVILDASWHLSFFGGVDRIKTKIEAYAHQENNVAELKSTEHLINSTKQGQDLFRRGAVHGELMKNLEPYDLPAPILTDIEQGGDLYTSWLPSSFDVPLYSERSGSGPGARSYEQEEL
mmetsp:Transcript_15437/g.51794  ORF Transcript_15437/g.51794 Transcript_15437/m.51794 type:complete len:272 (-) Transcript_15437:199-1014(-)